jgi:hypothetical protein
MLGDIEKWEEFKREDYRRKLKSTEELVKVAKTSEEEFKRKSDFAAGAFAGLLLFLNIPADIICKVHPFINIIIAKKLISYETKLSF